LPSDHGTQRQAPPDGLGHTDDVRRHARMLDREELAGASHAGLYLVVHQQNPMAIAQPAEPGQEMVWRHDQPAFALNRLDEDGRRVEWRTSLIAPSMASAPELQRYTCLGSRPGASSASRSASRI